MRGRTRPCDTAPRASSLAAASVSSRVRASAPTNRSRPPGRLAGTEQHSIQCPRRSPGQILRAEEPSASAPVRDRGATPRRTRSRRPVPGVRRLSPMHRSCVDRVQPRDPFSPHPCVFSGGTEMTFREQLAEQRWDDHRYYHHSRINQSLHLVSALSFILSYALVWNQPAIAVFIGWLFAMPSRHLGHFFFEPRGYAHVNHASH